VTVTGDLWWVAEHLAVIPHRGPADTGDDPTAVDRRSRTAALVGYVSD
jgi:hypothetical protein